MSIIHKIVDWIKRILGRGKPLICGDRVLWIIIAMLSIISILLVFSSTAKMAYDVTESRSSLKFLGTQLFYLGVSLLAVLILHRYDTDKYQRFSWAIWIICAVATLATYFVGSTANGAARWLPLGPIHIQPSEFLKIALIIHLSAMLTSTKGKIRDLNLFPRISKAERKQNPKIFANGTVRILMPILVSVAVILSAHTSSAILAFLISIFILFLAGVKKREIAKLLAIAALAGGLYYLMGMGRSDTAGGRLETWYATWTTDRKPIRIDYVSDTERSMVAIQNGGLFGQGAGQSAMRVEMIHPESDYAFAFFVEEYGLILSMLLLLLYMWIFFRAMWIYERCRDPFRELLVVSLATLILLQALLHVMVSINFLPETGQTLPLVSRGGSALFCTYMSLMLMLSVSAHSGEGEKPKSAPRKPETQQ